MAAMASPTPAAFTPAPANTTAMTRTPVQPSACSTQSTMDTPTILAAFQEVLTNTPNKRAARNHTSRAMQAAGSTTGTHPACGTPPPHAGVPSAHKPGRVALSTPCERSSENRDACGSTSKAKARGGASTFSMTATPGGVVLVRSSSKKRALFGARVAGPPVQAVTPVATRTTAPRPAQGEGASPAGADEGEGAGVDADGSPSGGHTATPESCNSTPTRDDTPCFGAKAAGGASIPPPTGSAGAGAGAGASAGEGEGVAAMGTQGSLRLPGRFLSPSFFQGGSDRRPKAQRALGSRLEQVAVAHASAAATPAPAAAQAQVRAREDKNTPRSFMRALSRKSSTVNDVVKSNNRADHNTTPRSMVRTFIASGLRSGDLNVDTPATLRRRSIRKQSEAAAGGAVAAGAGGAVAGAQGAGTSALQRLMHVVLLLVLFTLLVLVMTHLSRPFRRAVQDAVFGSRANAIRYT